MLFLSSKSDVVGRLRCASLVLAVLALARGRPTRTNSNSTCNPDMVRPRELMCHPASRCPHFGIHGASAGSEGARPSAVPDDRHPCKARESEVPK